MFPLVHLRCIAKEYSIGSFAKQIYHTVQLIIKQLAKVGMNKTTAESLSTAILSLDENPMLLKSMQTSSWKSAEQYYEKYVDDFNIQLGGEKTKDWIDSFDRERLKCVFFSFFSWLLLP